MSLLDDVKTALGLTDSEEDEAGPTFEERRISALADYQIGYRGVYGFESPEGTVVEVERTFDVFVKDDPDEKPVAEIAESRRKNGEVVDERSHEIVVDIDPSLQDMRLKNAVHQFLERWHLDHDPRPEPVTDERSDES